MGWLRAEDGLTLLSASPADPPALLNQPLFRWRNHDALSTDLDQAGLRPAKGANPRARHHYHSAFIKDCSFQSPFATEPGCLRLRSLFDGKEVIGQEIKDGFCQAKHDIPNQKGYPRDKRLEYIHDTSTDLWYKCCEYRGYRKDFSIQANHPRAVDQPSFPKFALQAMLGKLALPSYEPKEGVPEDYHEPNVGPLLQCNLMENLKHRLDDDTGERMIVDKVYKSGAGQQSGLGSYFKCPGTEGVALQKYAGGTSLRLLGDEAGVCVDTGGPGDPSPDGQRYHVFALSAPPPWLLAAVEERGGDPAAEVAWPKSTRAQEKRLAIRGGGAQPGDAGRPRSYGEFL